MSIDLIKKIREATGLSLKDIKKAVEELNTEDSDAVIQHLRKQGILKAASRSDRASNAGKIFAYVHEGRIGVMIELRSETDFVSRSDSFANLGNELCLHIAAFQPLFVSPETVSQEFIDKEIEIAKAQIESEGKPAEIVQKIVEGKKAKILEESSLVTQKFFKNPDITVGDRISEVSQATGEKIEITKFVIYHLS